MATKVDNRDRMQSSTMNLRATVEMKSAMTNRTKYRTTFANALLILITTAPTAAAQDGDYNNDGHVNEADYTNWRKSNINGATGYAVWRTNFGSLAVGETNLGGPTLQLVKGGSHASNNLNADGDWVWNVNITPDYALVPDSTGTPIDAALGFTSNRPVEAATRGSGFDTGTSGVNANPGNVIFNWETLSILGGTGDCGSPNLGICPVGIQIGGVGRTQVFAALGSPNHTSGTQQFLQIVADRPVVTQAAPNTSSTITIRGAYLNKGRIAQITGGSAPDYTSSNFDTYNATFTRNARGGDTNLDEIIDGADYDTLLLNWQQSGRRWYEGDFDGNGGVDDVDYDILLDATLGDFNFDRSVDAADYVVWRKNPTIFDVTQRGYAVWRSNFGRTVGAGSTAPAIIPEPATFVLLCIAALALVQSRLARGGI
jgi:hypothetical protein